MALIKCRECGHEISDQAKMCPSCGYGQEKKQEPSEVYANIATKFKNPLNGYVEEITGPVWLWAFLFGPIYCAVKGMWRDAVIYIVTCLLLSPVGGFVLVWIIYPFMIKNRMRKEYLRKGWEPVA